ncbi:hypothetical protein ACO22_07988, partial [Paracoccidioides brasiliensis]
FHLPSLQPLSSHIIKSASFTAMLEVCWMMDGGRAAAAAASSSAAAAAAAGDLLLAAAREEEPAKRHLPLLARQLAADFAHSCIYASARGNNNDKQHMCIKPMLNSNKCRNRGRHAIKQSCIAIPAYPLKRHTRVLMKPVLVYPSQRGWEQLVPSSAAGLDAQGWPNVSNKETVSEEASGWGTSTTQLVAADVVSWPTFLCIDGKGSNANRGKPYVTERAGTRQPDYPLQEVLFTLINGRHQRTDNSRLDWHDIPLKTSILRMLAQLSSRVFLGEKIRRNPFPTLSIRLSLLGPSVQWLALKRRLVANSLPSCCKLRLEIEQARAIINPVLEERRMAKLAAVRAGLGNSQNDIWMRCSGWSNLAEAATMILFEREEIVQEPRNEIVTVIQSQGWQRTTLYKLKLKKTSNYPIKQSCLKGSMVICRLSGKTPGHETSAQAVSPSPEHLGFRMDSGNMPARDASLQPMRSSMLCAISCSSMIFG